MPEESYLKLANIPLHNAFKCSIDTLFVLGMWRGRLSMRCAAGDDWQQTPQLAGCQGVQIIPRICPPLNAVLGKESHSPRFQMLPAACLSPSVPFSVALSSQCPRWCAGGRCRFALWRHTLWSRHCICVNFCRARMQWSYNYRYFPVVERDQKGILWVQQYQLFHRGQNMVCGISVFLWPCF